MKTRSRKAKRTDNSLTAGTPVYGYLSGNKSAFSASQRSASNQSMQRLLSQNQSSVNNGGYSFQQDQDVVGNPQAVVSTPPKSVINDRIDVRAQYALLRLFKGPANDAKDATDLFNDVDSGKIKGIFGDDLAIAVKLADKRGTVRWELVPPGQDAVMLKDNTSDTPVIIFKAAAGTKPRLDQALLTVYRAHKASTAATSVVVPAGHPRFTAEGSPSARPSRIVELDVDPTDGTLFVDTHGDMLTYDWPAQVKSDVPSPDCFEVGFLQTLNKSLAFADYTSGPNDTNPGFCMPFPSRLPIRDGFAASPVWFIGGNSKGIGFNVIGTCQPNVPNNPFPAPVTSQQAGVTAVDKPGGLFRVRHRNDNTKLLRQVTEDHEFKVWLAARLRSAPERNVASYQFIKNATWTVERTTEFFHDPSGQVKFRFIRNETKVTEFGDGQGSSTPDLGQQTANTSSPVICVP